MSTLADALKSTATSSKSNGSKNPTFYSREKNTFISDMATSPNETTRIEVAGNEHIPAGTLKQMLNSETDTDVLRVILMNPRTPLKAIQTFTSDARSDVFDDDEEITEHLKSRANANGSIEDGE